MDIELFIHHSIFSSREDEGDKRTETPSTPSHRGEGWDETNKKSFQFICHR